MAKFDGNIDARIDDIKTEATKGLYAGAGVADLAVEAVREYVADVSKRIAGVRGEVTSKVTGVRGEMTAMVTDVRTKVGRIEPATLVSTGVEAVSSDAKARRAAIETKVAELQSTAKTLPVKAQSALKENVATYRDLAKRGELVVKRLRGEVAEVVDGAADKVEDVVGPDPAPAQEAAATKTTTTTEKAPAKKAPAQKAPAKKAPAKKTAAKKAPTKKAPVRKTTATKAPAERTTTGAQKAPAKKTTPPDA